MVNIEQVRSATLCTKGNEPRSIYCGLSGAAPVPTRATSVANDVAAMDRRSTSPKCVSFGDRVMPVAVVGEQQDCKWKT
jgi:hypothetical protein